MLAAIQLAAGEFLPVQAPVEQLEPTQFVNFDTDSLETTSCDCVDGVNVALQKDATGALDRAVSVSLVNATSWRVRNVTFEPAELAGWLELAEDGGNSRGMRSSLPGGGATLRPRHPPP